MIDPQGAPVDAAERARTLATKESFLVQAPAGSGKTQLLTQRLLKLLAEVNDPEEILAITFTIAATAEMKNRVLGELQNAQKVPPSPDDPEMKRLAHAALARDAARGWNLLQQPQRLNILTIDAVCLAIAHETPLLSRLGGSLSPTDKPQPLYDQAARRTLSRLGDGGELSDALRALLELRAANLPGCQALIAGMLDKRDQWRRVMPLSNPVDWPEVRRKLEKPLQDLHEEAFAEARSLFAQDPAFVGELLELLEHACGNVAADSPLLLLREVEGLHHLTSHAHWLCLCDFLLTRNGELRKKITIEHGFKSGDKAPEKDAKRRYMALLQELAANEPLLDHLLALRELPPLAFTDAEFQLLQHLLIILRHAVAELRLVFAERSVVDFVELGLAAYDVLTNEEGLAGELAFQIAEPWRHLLIDEFQDTSQSQYKILTLLVEGWDSGERGTCFIVGDPMQSIYGFRQAEVELFERTRRYGLGTGTATLPLTTVQLQTNFRSHAELVNRLNEVFTAVFARNTNSDGEDYHVSFAPSEAHARTERETPAVNVWPTFLPSKASPDEANAIAMDEARQVVRIIQRHLPQLQAARLAHEEFTVAVLVRARSHLALIARELRKAGITFRAVEIEQLGTRQEVQDLTALTRAILHPMDRIAWLSVLRAPWCGLTLKDLYTLCNNDDRASASRPVLTLLRERTALLSPDGQQRALRVCTILEEALRGKHRQASLARWVERTWATLGGNKCVDRTGYENARAFFNMLELLGPHSAELTKRLEELCAQPDPGAEERCGVQLMTIHKAKGLGFNVVIVPGLGRNTQSDEQLLLRWIEQTRLVGPDETVNHSLVVAPIGTNGQPGGIYKWIGKQRTRRQDEETKRLLYVAATRARDELHLLGTAVVKETKEGGEALSFGYKRSLLATAWPAIEQDFERAWQEQQRETTVAQQTELPFSPGERVLTLRRLPSNLQTIEKRTASIPSGEEQMGEHVARPRGSLATRAFGTVVHALMEDLAHLPGIEGDPVPQAILATLENWRTRAGALLRAQGLPRTEADQQAAAVVRALQSVVRDPLGRWILGGRVRAQSEVAWSTWSDEEGLRGLRGDRIFRAGEQPGSLGETHLWVIDYKTAQHGAAGMEEFLAGEKQKYARQLEAYGDVLRKLPGNDLPLRLALYFPLLNRLVWW